MEAAICTLVSQFQSFAGKDGSSSTLSKEEFHNLVSSQLPNFVKVGFPASVTAEWRRGPRWYSERLEVLPQPGTGFSPD